MLDLRYINQYLLTQKFKYEGLDLVPTLFERNDHFFTFDLKSGYHHVDIHEDCWTFSWNEKFYIYRLYDETEGSTVFRAPRKLYRHPRAKRKGVYRFPRGSKYRRPRGFHRIRYLYCTSMQPIKLLSVQQPH